MPVQIVPSPIVAPRRSRVGVTGSILDVAEADPGIEPQSHEGVAKVVGVEGGRLAGDRDASEPSQGPPCL